MVPDDRARKYHERLAQSPLTVALLTANSLHNLARKIDREHPRNDGIADSVRALAMDLQDFSLRESAPNTRITAADIRPAVCLPNVDEL